MTTTRKATNGNGHAAKAPVKRVPVYHSEFDSPLPAQVVITPATQANYPLFRLVYIIGSVVIAAATVAWHVSGEVYSLKRDVQSLASSVTDFKDSIKELNGNIKYLSSGTWTRSDMMAFCKDLEALNSGKAIRCPTVTLSTGSLK